jgi:hypothetical protein
MAVLDVLVELGPLKVAGILLAGVVRCKTPKIWSCHVI